MNVLFLHPEMLFYKIRIYNLLAKKLEAQGVKFYIWCNNVQEGEQINFRLIDKPFSISNLNYFLEEKDIHVVINILFGASIIPFYISSLLLLKVKKIKHIYYGHGLDLRATQKKWKVLLQNIIHLFFDRMLLYGDAPTKFLWTLHHKKIYYANNTLLLEGYEKYSSADKIRIKKKYGIFQDKLVLFSGRIQPRKRLDVLIGFFLNLTKEFKDFGLVIVGDGLDEENREIVAKQENIYYLGGIYDKELMQEIFYISDIFCIPGLIGLGLVEALYWGKPVFTIQGGHGPEIGYLEENVNGFIVKNSKELIERLFQLLNDDNHLMQLSIGARSKYLKEATIDKMLQGFFDVLNSLRCGPHLFNIKE